MSKWNYARSVPKTLYVACSGGVDSVAAAAILSEWRDVTLLHFHHGEHADDSERAVVDELANTLNIPILYGDYTGTAVLNNREAQWRKARYNWFHTFDEPVVVAHTLDDAVESYMITCLRGEGHYMSYSNKNVIRPFLFTDKTSLQQYCVDKNLKWWHDETNDDVDFALRNRVRHRLVPAAIFCEPGLKNMVKRRLVEQTPRCCVCKTTENLHADGWYGYRCNSVDCVPF